MKTYSVHSHTEQFHTDDLEEAITVATSMAEHFGSSYIVENATNNIIDRY